MISRSAFFEKLIRAVGFTPVGKTEYRMGRQMSAMTTRGVWSTTNEPGNLDSLNTFTGHAGRNFWHRTKLGHRLAPTFVWTVPLAQT